jgi:hypothetical protein
LFSDTVEGVKASAVMHLDVDLPASRVEPLAWLRHVLTELPQRACDADITDLLPFNFPKTPHCLNGPDAAPIRRPSVKIAGVKRAGKIALTIQLNASEALAQIGLASA